MSTSVLFLAATPTDDQPSQGTAQYESVGMLREHATGEWQGVGFAGCPYTTGKIEHYEARAWGAATGVVLAHAARLVFYDRQAGWSDVTFDPRATEGYEVVADPDGSFVLIGGCGADDGRAVRRLSP